ncbi:MAG: Uma2 family endonuclease [Desulfobacterales bacterium]|nr:Uma2 family endonuclease [Desulfobacterales bacterium]
MLRGKKLIDKNQSLWDFFKRGEKMAPLDRKLNEKLDEKFSYADYLSWPDDERWEIIEGVAYDMSPAPAREHQRVSAIIFAKIYNFLSGKECEVYFAPFDVRLAETKDEADEEIETVVQPDIVVICDQNKLDKRGCLGAPDITVEILSPSTSYKDQTEKLLLYEKHGVKEYWIVNHDAKYIMIYCLEGVKYGKPEYLTENDILESRALEGLKIDLSEVWATPPFSLDIKKK